MEKERNYIKLSQFISLLNYLAFVADDFYVKAGQSIYIRMKYASIARNNVKLNNIRSCIGTLH